MRRQKEKKLKEVGTTSTRCKMPGAGAEVGVAPGEHVTQKGAGGKLERGKPPAVAVAKKTLNITLMDHCFFCVRKTTSKDQDTDYNNIDWMETLEEVPCAQEIPSSETRLLSALNKTWSCLLHGGSWNLITDSSSAQFIRLPKMCCFCAEKLANMSKVMGELITEINRLGKVIRDSRYGGVHSWRIHRFEQTLKSCGVDWNSINDTLRFLGQPLVEASSSSNSEHESLVDKDARQEKDCNDVDAGMESDDSNYDPSYIKEEETYSSEYEEPDDALTEYLEEQQKFTEIPSEARRQNKDDEDNFDLEASGLHDLNEKTRYDGQGCSELKMKTYEIRVDVKTGKTFHECTINGCGKKYATGFSGLRRHQRRIHNFKVASKVKQYRYVSIMDPTSAKKRLKCIIDGCEKNYSDFHGLGYHQRKVHNFHSGMVHSESFQDIRKQKCDICKAAVPTCELYEHVRAHVGDDYLQKCPNPVCSRFVFCTTSGLSRHQKKNKRCKNTLPHSEKFVNLKRICEVCSQDFTTATALRHHLLDCHETESGKLFSCPIESCEKMFGVKQSVLLHLPLHVVRNGFDLELTQNCDVCQKKVKLEEMASHLKDFHPLNEIVKCVHCPFLFVSRDNLVEHVYVHRHSCTLSCDICGMEEGPTFQFHGQLRQHYFHMHQVGSLFNCEKCDRRFYYLNGLEKHMKNIHATDSHTKSPHNEVIHGETPEARQRRMPKRLVRKFACEALGCDKIFAWRPTLLRHVASVHNKDENTSHCCDQCGKSFPNNEALTAHLESHRQQTLVHRGCQLKCHVAGCTKVFAYSSRLFRHVAVAHNGEKPYVCEQCGKAYGHRLSLKSHVESTHSKLSYAVCDICGEGFASLATLRHHKLIHTGERPFSCDICGQRFRTKAPLITHLKGHAEKGVNFRPTGSMKHNRKRVERRK